MSKLSKYGFEFDDNGWIEISEDNVRRIKFPKKKNGGVEKILQLNYEDRWALVLMLWEGKYRLATRWFWTPIGVPNSRGYPTWHILPEELSLHIIRGLKGEGKLSDNDCKFCLEKLGRK